MKKNNITKKECNESEHGYDYKVTNIAWDVDDVEDFDDDVNANHLPESIIVTVPEEICAVDEEEEWISDYLSDTYGFCHNGFIYEPVGQFEESMDIRKHRFVPKMDTSTKAYKSMKDKARERERRDWNQILRNGDYDDFDDEEYDDFDESTDFKSQYKTITIEWENDYSELGISTGQQEDVLVDLNLIDPITPERTLDIAIVSSLKKRYGKTFKPVVDFVTIYENEFFDELGIKQTDFRYDDFDESVMDGVKEIGRSVKNGVKDAAHKTKKAVKRGIKKIGDVIKGPFRKGDHVTISGGDGESVQATITKYELGGKKYEVMLQNNYNEDSFDKPDFEEEFTNILDEYEKLPDEDTMQDDLEFFGDTTVQEKEDFQDKDSRNSRVRIYHVSILGCKYDVRFEYDKRTFDVIDRTFIISDSKNSFDEKFDVKRADAIMVCDDIKGNHPTFEEVDDRLTDAGFEIKEYDREDKAHDVIYTHPSGVTAIVDFVPGGLITYFDYEIKESVCEVHNKDWFGIKGAKYIYHGDWADPEIQYDGMSLNYFDVEEFLLDEYREEHPEDKNDKGFDDWMKMPEQKSSIQSALDDLVQGGCGTPLDEYDRDEEVIGDYMVEDSSDEELTDKLNSIQFKPDENDIATTLQIDEKDVELVDEKIDDGCDDDENKYVMCRVFNIKYNGSSYTAKFYYGDITEDVGYVDVRQDKSM